MTTILVDLCSVKTVWIINDHRIMLGLNEELSPSYFYIVIYNGFYFDYRSFFLKFKPVNFSLLNTSPVVCLLSFVWWEESTAFRSLITIVSSGLELM